MEDVVQSDTFMSLMELGCTISMVGSYIRVDKDELSFFVHRSNFDSIHVNTRYPTTLSTTTLKFKSEFVVDRRSNKMLKNRHPILGLVEHYCITTEN